MSHCEFAVIGAGIAGASVAYELARHGRVLLLEREPQPGHHTTGRSAAFLVPSYGNPVVRMLTRGGRPFLEQPPEGFVPHPLLHPRPVLWVGREDQRESLAAALKAGEESGAGLRRLTCTRGTAPTTAPISMRFAINPSSYSSTTWLVARPTWLP